MFLLCLVFLAILSTNSFLSSAQDNCKIIAALQEQGHILLSKLMPCQYYKEYPPPTRVPNAPVEVQCALYVQDINSINAADMDFRIDLILHMSWEDTRLNLDKVNFVEGEDMDYIPLPSYALEYLWIPDPYISNSKDAAITSMTTVYASLAIHNNHTIRYSARIYSLVACQMEFQKYPMDVQTCPISLQSFKHSSREVKLMWREVDAVTLNPDLKLLQFSHRISNTTTSNITNADFGGYGNRPIVSLTMELEFSRLIGHHLVQTYIPSFLIVSLSWFSFYMGLDAIPGRVTLLVTCLLTLTTLFTGIKNDLPAVAYVKAIDVWMAGCIFFAFMAMGEFILCKVFSVVMAKSKETKKPVKPSGSYNYKRISPSATGKDNYSFNNLSIINIKNAADNNNVRDWVPPEDVERGDNRGFVSDDETPNKIVKMNGKHIDLAHSVTEIGSVPTPANRPPRSGASFQSTPAATRWRGRKKWIKTLRELEMQWDDPVTGDKKILWEEIDYVSRFAFPIIFFFFTILYFPLLMLI